VSHHTACAFVTHLHANAVYLSLLPTFPLPSLPLPILPLPTLPTPLKMVAEFTFAKFSGCPVYRKTLTNHTVVENEKRD